MKNLLALCLALALCFGLAALGESDPLVGAWETVSVLLDGRETDLTGELSRYLAVEFLFGADGSFSCSMRSPDGVFEIGGMYEADGEKLILTAGQKISVETFLLDGDTLVLSEETDGAVTVLTLVRAGSSELIGTWRTAALIIGDSTVDISDSSDIGVTLEFRPDGVCIGVLTKEGLDETREMTYVAEGGMIILTEEDSASTIEYTIEGDIMNTVMSEDGVSITYIMVREN